jgi:hypothetical protein
MTEKEKGVKQFTIVEQENAYFCACPMHHYTRMYSHVKKLENVVTFFL